MKTGLDKFAQMIFKRFDVVSKGTKTWYLGQ